MAVALGVLLGGCAGSDSPPTTPRKTTSLLNRGGLVKPGTRGSITVEAGNAVPLGISPEQVVRRLGEPAVPLHRKDANYRCMFYNLVGQPRNVQLQYCFAEAKLRLVASYIRDR